MPVDFRNESLGDRAGIRAVLVEAFPTAAEADLVERLRNDGSAILSLVAEAEGEIVGHAMLSRMQSPPGMLGLAPVAVLAPYRRQGIAARLMEAGLSRAKADGWSAVFVLGDPAYYRCFGFDPALAAGFDSPYAGPHLMAIELKPGALDKRTGKLEYAAPFADLE
ncbi:MAG TPA: N-acetyltransferase [Rhizomicrobium sp.]|jgi:putative acetyltransferase